MKIVKWGTVIAVTFAVSWVLLFTFTQEPFRGSAPVKIFWYTTPGEFPMYTYAAAAFGVGLFIGFFVAAYYYIAGRAGIHSKKKEIKRLEELVKDLGGAKEREIKRFEKIVSDMNDEMERLRLGTAKAQDRITKSQKAVGEKPQGRITKSQKAIGEKDLLA